MSAGDFSMMALFREEADAQERILSAGLLALERDPRAAAELEACMRAAHSIKGAARVVGLQAAVRVAHALEDCFVAAQSGGLLLAAAHIDVLLTGTDLLVRIAQTSESALSEWQGSKAGEIEAWLASVASMLESNAPVPAAAEPAPQAAPVARASGEEGEPRDRQAADRVLRVTADNLNRVLAGAGESLIESRWASSFGDRLLKLKRLHRQLAHTLETARERERRQPSADAAAMGIADAQRLVAECQHVLAERVRELESFEQRSVSLAHRLYEDALACRMRPFADGVEGLPRMVRDLARSLGKRARLEIVGMSTQVDRDILARLDGPLGHLLRNAVDHGVELPEVRLAAGKPAEARLRLEARHNAGALHIFVTDDGRGVDLAKLREEVVARQLVAAEAAAGLSEAELVEFLFLPGFSMKGTVTEVSGRGVGLDAVREMAKEIRGTVRATTEPGKGTRFHLQLPVTLSVVRTLLAEIAGEPYAFPLASVSRTVLARAESIAMLEGRPHVAVDGRRIGLVSARQVLAVDGGDLPGGDVPVIVIGDHAHTYGLVVDRFLGERELVVQQLDARLGKIKDIAAGALMEDGSPVLIVDPEDMLRSMDKLASNDRVGPLPQSTAPGAGRRKRVLVVDDSLTVRELERKLLVHRGYEVEVAVDGMDGWNAVRTGRFDLVITDVDMPRMDGIELVGRINRDPNLRGVPVMIMSYKDREGDRQRGLDAGAAYYLTKGSFLDDALLGAVADLIGEPAA